MLRIEMLPARQGDALWIEYGDPAAPHRIMVDAGTPATVNTVRDRVEQLNPRDRAFELLVVTHVDADHIGGVLPLLKDASLNATFADVWFNGWHHLLDKPALETLGPVDGERLSVLLRRHAWNEAFGRRAVMAPPVGLLPTCTLPGDLHITVLAPGPAELEALKPFWEEEVRNAGLQPGTAPEPTPPELGGLEALGSQAVPNVQRLANAPFKADTAPANGSSIVLLLEHEEQRVLLCGDAFPSTITAAIDRLLAQTARDCLALSALKLPHHGSRRNVNLLLAQRVTAPSFLLSSDGTHTRHPNDEAVARILAVHPDAELCFNYKTKYNDIWGRADVIAAGRHTALYPGDGETGLAVTLQPTPSLG